MGSMGGLSRDGLEWAIDAVVMLDRNRKRSRKLTFFILYLFKSE